MERQSKGSRGLEAYCKGGQDPPRAVAPLKKKKNYDLEICAAIVNNSCIHIFSIRFVTDVIFPRFSFVNNSRSSMLRVVELPNRKKTKFCTGD